MKDANRPTLSLKKSPSRRLDREGLRMLEKQSDRLTRDLWNLLHSRVTGQKDREEIGDLLAALLNVHRKWS